MVSSRITPKGTLSSGHMISRDLSQRTSRTDHRQRKRKDERRERHVVSDPVGAKRKTKRGDATVLLRLCHFRHCRRRIPNPVVRPPSLASPSPSPMSIPPVRLFTRSNTFALHFLPNLPSVWLSHFRFVSFPSRFYPDKFAVTQQLTYEYNCLLDHNVRQDPLSPPNQKVQTFILC